MIYAYIIWVTAMLAIRLPEDLESRLDKLAIKTGRTKTYYAREAISEYLDDLEDYYLADSRLRSKAKSISIDEVESQLGLAD